MLYLLDQSLPEAPFPPVADAETDPNGLLAVGGDLLPARLLNAYREGIFPWYSVNQPILWWSPDPRMVLFPGEMQVSRSLRKSIRRGEFSVSFDQDFPAVIRACAAPRKDADGTWIVTDMLRAYDQLHRLGHAHSVEIWQAGQLVGGLYGVSIGRVFFGESMFSRVTDSSKIALRALEQRALAWRFPLIDCQVYSEHLESLGAREIPRTDFCALIADAVNAEPPTEGWPLAPFPAGKLL